MRQISPQWFSFNSVDGRRPRKQLFFQPSTYSRPQSGGGSPVCDRAAAYAPQRRHLPAERLYSQPPPPGAAATSSGVHYVEPGQVKPSAPTANNFLSGQRHAPDLGQPGADPGPCHSTPGLTLRAGQPYNYSPIIKRPGIHRGEPNVLKVPHDRRSGPGEGGYPDGRLAAGWLRMAAASRTAIDCGAAFPGDPARVPGAARMP